MTMQSPSLIGAPAGAAEQSSAPQDNADFGNRMGTVLDDFTRAAKRRNVAACNDVIKLAPKAASLTVTLP